MRQVILIAHNVRSSHNVGSLLRTAEGLGAAEVFLTGYTPYPEGQKDERLPHIARKVHKDISKTALDAEKLVQWQHHQDVAVVIKELRGRGFKIAAIEQAADSIELPDFAAPEKVALIVGRGVEGIEPEILELCDIILEIPMFGHKESFNVVQAAAMGLYHCRFQA